MEHQFNLKNFGIPYGARVALVLPNGPELCVCLLGTINSYCAVPILLSSNPVEFLNEFKQTKVTAVICQEESAGIQAAAQLLSIKIIILKPDTNTCGLFSLAPSPSFNPSSSTSVLSTYTYVPTLPGFTPLARTPHNEIVLVLQTSGTAGKKKVVPFSLDMIIIGVSCIILSWGLSPQDICLNMMPLYHIGGIVRNLLAPILSGGSLISCSSFDAGLFWDILGTIPFTWYYAAPTMHQTILLEASNRKNNINSHGGALPSVDSIRFIANAAGGLLPVLAESLRDTFQCVILTSYGMTEW